MTHQRLVELGEAWLRRIGCGIVLREYNGPMNTEYPDVIGWKRGMSVLIECKVSRGDFLSDFQKSFRKDPSKGMGHWRFMLIPAGSKIISPLELPKGWGLLEATERTVKKVHGVPSKGYQWGRFPFQPNVEAERRLLLSVVRRLTIRGHLEEVYDRSFIQKEKRQ